MLTDTSGRPQHLLDKGTDSGTGGINGVSRKGGQGSCRAFGVGSAGASLFLFRLASNTKRREGMWLWECELRRLGLRRQSPRYWQCERRYGMPGNAYLSVFSRAQERQTASDATTREQVDF